MITDSRLLKSQSMQPSSVYNRDTTYGNAVCMVKNCREKVRPGQDAELDIGG